MAPESFVKKINLTVLWNGQTEVFIEVLDIAWVFPVVRVST